MPFYINANSLPMDTAIVRRSGRMRKPNGPCGRKFTAIPAIIHNSPCHAILEEHMPPHHHLEKRIPAQTIPGTLITPSRKAALWVLPPVTLGLSILLLGLLIRSWQLSVGLVGMLFIHEMGHYLAFKLKGIR